MKAIITTPTDIKFSALIWHHKDKKLVFEELPFIKALNTKGKHLYIEYDENNNNLLKVIVDLDEMGLSNIKTAEEYEKFFKAADYSYDFGVKRMPKQHNDRIERKH